MNNIGEWLEEYDESHQNRVNKVLHWLCVPLIVLSLLGLLWSVSLPFSQKWFFVQPNLAIVLVVLAELYYFLLSPALSLAMLLVLAVMIVILYSLSTLATPLWFISVVVFILAWIGQFIGHQYEGKSPSFFKDVQFLLIGPLWILAFVFRKLGLRY